MRTVFVLGTERSGSTWVANLLDAHPDVELWMEPLADWARLAPGLPGREVPVGRPPPALCQAFRGAVDALPRAKYPLLYRPGRAPALRRVDAAVARGSRRAARALGLAEPLWARRHELLNLSALAIPWRQQTRKRAQPSHRVIKELRLHFQVGLVEAAFPDAVVLVTLRDPVSQLASILRLRRGGRLRELGRALGGLLAAAAASPRFERQRGWLVPPGAPVEPLGDLVRWWLLAHQVLLEDLKAGGLAYRLVVHEDLCRDPQAGVAGMLGFCGLPPSREVDAFLRWSTSADGDPDSPVDTRRDTRTWLERSARDIDPDLRRRVEAQIRCALAATGVDGELRAHLARSGIAG